MRKTKIIATIGPASRSPENLAALFKAGCNVVRINMSHSGQAEAAGIVADVRSISGHVAIMLDTRGPEVRTTEVAAPVALVNGATVIMRGEEGPTTAEVIRVTYRGLARVLDEGTAVLLADGQIELEVVALEPHQLHCRVVKGGMLGSKKGVNIPGVRLPMPFISEQDASDIAFAVRHGFDFIAASFTGDAEDVLRVRRLVEREGGDIGIVAKIESRYAVKNLGEIVAVADGVMVARGDLGVEIPLEEVPVVQKQIIDTAIAAGKPVIVATEMLESMIHNPRPTRAETSDVANAIFEGADAVMLSGETATGRHPVEAVATMDRILRQVEGHQWRVGQFGQVLVHSHSPEDEATPELRMVEALSRAVASLSRDLSVRAIFTPTASGRTARMVAAERPAAPVVALTPDPATARRLMLCWGVLPVAVDDLAQGHLAPEARRIAALLGLAKPGEFLLLVYNPTAEPGSEAPTVTVLQA